MKKLSEMTLEELWALFPIFLTEPQEYWQQWYKEEKEYIMNLLPCEAENIYHIGSTAIQGIWAKPIIDILIEAKDVQELRLFASILQENGYLLMSQRAEHISLNKGYTEKGFSERVFHIHLRLSGDIDEVHFREYLNSHLDIAKEYEALKLSLWKVYEYNRDGYTNAKTEFVRKYTNLAKEEKNKK